MKKCLLIIIMVLLAGSGYAKDRDNGFTFGVKAGVNVNNYIMSDVNVFDLNNKTRVGFVAGFTAEQNINSWLGVEADVLASMQGSNIFWDNAGTVELKSSVYYINIPITANFYIFKGLSLKAGVQPGFKVGAKLSGDSPLSNVERSGTYFNRFDLSIPVGVAYDFSIFRIEARYAVGATNIFRNYSRILGEARNSVFSFTFGVKF